MAGDTIKGVAVYLLPGQKVKLKAPINASNSQGYFVRQDPLPNSFLVEYPNMGELKRGFVVENKDVGNIDETDEEEAAVIYHHKQPYPNAIWFWARTGERGLVKVVSVPIHDHSTIVHGGPAYGTYFDDDVER
jgi:hypothetical protein